MTMTRTLAFITFSLCAAVVAAASARAVQGQGAQPTGRGEGRGAQAAPAKPRAGHPSGKLVLWGDVAQFVGPGLPDNCIQSNRYKRGQRIGFRMAAIDGGTGEPENTAMLIAHLRVGGKTIDVPMRFRGAPDPAQAAPQPNGYTRPITNLWTGWWRVPDDAPIGVLTYTVTATDRFGRTATFEPFSYDTSQLTIVE
jgi:hypothetical protein